jgi:hypothetical protein
LKQQSAAVVATQKRQPAAPDPKKLEKSKETLLEAAHRKTQGMMLNNDDIQVMVEKWQKWQGAFSDYALKPCCIHIILEDRVKCLNVWSGKLEEPVNKKGGETDLCCWSFGEFFRYTCGGAHRRLDHGRSRRRSYGCLSPVRGYGQGVGSHRSGEVGPGASHAGLEPPRIRSGGEGV